MVAILLLLRVGQVATGAVRRVECWVDEEPFWLVVVLVTYDVPTGKVLLEHRAVVADVGAVVLLRAVAIRLPDDLRAAVDNEVVPPPGLVELERPVFCLPAALRLVLLALAVFDRKIGGVDPQIDVLTMY